MEKVILDCLGAGNFGGGFQEGFGVFFGSGRRQGKLECWCLQVCKPSPVLDGNSQVLFSYKFTDFNGHWEREWVLVLGFRP